MYKRQALSGAQEEKAAVISDARVKAGAEYDRIVTDAKTAADKLMDDARKEAVKEQEKTIKQAKDQIEEDVYKRQHFLWFFPIIS